tara:strand:- start:1667 stop:2650 length:984 start_codon:yes stop_codon:yes gene_type:complete
VELAWDWRLARVYDGENQIVDECIWSGNQSISATVKRLKILKQGHLTEEARTLLERNPEIKPIPITSVEDWPPLSPSETELLQKCSLILAEQEVIEAASEPDYRLEHLVRAVEESRITANNLESQLVEWVGMFLPSLDINEQRTTITEAVQKTSDFQELAAHLNCEIKAEVNPNECASIRAMSEQIALMNSTANTIEQAMQKLARSHLPSLSKLLGPSIAAKLCVSAHGRSRLARLPAGTIQVLGAEKSFFSHIQKGTKPPKHGHIFQHTWISRSPKSMRGSIARMLAAKAAIAVRTDCYGGEPWGDKQLAEVEQKVGAIRSRKRRR